MSLKEISKLPMMEIMERAENGCPKALRIIKFNLIANTKEMREQQLIRSVWGGELQ